MTNDLISREAAIKMIRENGLRGEGYSREEREDNLVDMLECLPAVDAAPVVHGRWVEGTLFSRLICSECGHEALYNENANEPYVTKFCPECGARMG